MMATYLRWGRHTSISLFFVTPDTATPKGPFFSKEVCGHCTGGIATEVFNLQCKEVDMIALVGKLICIG